MYEREKEGERERGKERQTTTQTDRQILHTEIEAERNT